MTRKDRFKLGDSFSAVITLSEDEQAELSHLQEEPMPEGNREGLEVKEFGDGWAVFEDGSEAPVTIRNVSVFDSEDDAREALEFYAEVRA